MNKEHVLMVVLGRSASGKTSLVEKLCEKTNLSQVVSYTTRPPREENEKGHIFVQQQDYEIMKNNDEVAVETQIAGYYYWPTIRQLYENDIFVCDYVGLKKLQELNLLNLKLVTVYIHIDEQERQRRALELRGDDKKKFISRSFSEKKQFEELEKNVGYDYSIRNTNFANAYSVLRWISIVEGILTPDKLIKEKEQ